MPAVIAPSPMMATAWRSSPFCLAAIAMPSAAEMLVDECAVPKVSYSLSPRCGKPDDAAQLAQRGHALAPAGQDLVRIGLVAHVPHQPVVRRVEHVVQRDRELDRAQVGAQVAAGARHAVEHEGAHFVGQLLELRRGQLAQVRRVVDRWKSGASGAMWACRCGRSVVALDHHARPAPAKRGGVGQAAARQRRQRLAQQFAARRRASASSPSSDT